MSQNLQVRNLSDSTHRALKARAADDGIFVALAEAATQPLLTIDLRLARDARRYARADVVTHLDA